MSRTMALRPEASLLSGRAVRPILRFAANGFVLAALAMCSGCATVGRAGHEYIGGYQWVPDPTAPVCEQVIWKQVPKEHTPGLCSDLRRFAAEGTSCALGCIIVSPYSAEQARTIDLWGDTLFDHEMRHATGRMRHPS